MLLLASLPPSLNGSRFSELTRDADLAPAGALNLPRQPRAGGSIAGVRLVWRNERLLENCLQ